MDAQHLIDQTTEFVRAKFSGESSGHDWWHVYRVWQVACKLAAAEGADRVVVELAALLHDVADWKFHAGDESAGPQAAREWLTQLHAPPPTIERVCDVIAQVTFKGAGVATPITSLEAAVVQDADRLDAIGAIGIARAFAYGGHKGRAMHDPACPPQLHDSFASYKKNAGPTVNHFYEKLLLLKDRMHTATARRWAASRHAFMEAFLDRFYREWESADERVTPR